MGARVVLIEKGRMGGDCLNYGCVPSKALIAAAHAAQAARTGGRFGVDGHAPAVDFRAVHDHVHGVIAAIAPNDSVERFEGLGVRVVKARSEEHTSDLQSLMLISYAVFSLQKQKETSDTHSQPHHDTMN